MTVFSLAQATAHLGIDTKTLHHWLSQARLPLLPHPEDARKKALSQEHLLLLARLHQRHLPAFLQAEPPALPLASDPEPSAALIAHLDGLHTQIATLQQQVAELICLLQTHPPVPAAPPPPAQETNVLPHLPALVPSPKRLPSPPMSLPVSNMQVMDTMR